MAYYEDNNKGSKKKGEFRIYKTSYVERIPIFDDKHKYLLCLNTNDSGDKRELLMNSNSLENLIEWEAAFNFAVSQMNDNSAVDAPENDPVIAIKWPPLFLKSGVLFKQRDAIKGWRAKHFVRSFYFYFFSLLYC